MTTMAASKEVTVDTAVVVYLPFSIHFLRTAAQMVLCNEPAGMCGCKRSSGVQNIGLNPKWTS